LKETSVTVWKSKRKVMQRYDLTAQMYDERYAEEQEAKYKKALETVKIVNGAVLDVGCGSGLFFNQVAFKAQTVVGVDVSRKLLLQANEHSKSFGNVYVIQADADHLPFKNGFFDDVFAFTVLQNMPKPNLTLNELKRVAKLDGYILVTALKKAFALNVFIDLVEGAGLWVVGFADDEDLKCYVACCRLLSA
jgi:ubiquinone/menaquinone biosynthesis C-methylase UbiE